MLLVAGFLTQISKANTVQYNLYNIWKLLWRLSAISSEMARRTAAKFCMRMRAVCMQDMGWVLCR